MQQIDSLRIISALIACKGLHEFDHILSQELINTLQCDLVAFYLYCEKAHVFVPVSGLLTDPDSPGLSRRTIAGKRTMKEAVVQSGQAILENNLGVSGSRGLAGLRYARGQNTLVKLTHVSFGLEHLATAFMNDPVRNPA